MSRISEHTMDCLIAVRKRYRQDANIWWEANMDKGGGETFGTPIGRPDQDADFFVIRPTLTRAQLRKVVLWGDSPEATTNVRLDLAVRRRGIKRGGTVRTIQDQRDKDLAVELSNGRTWITRSDAALSFEEILARFGNREVKEPVEV